MVVVEKVWRTRVKEFRQYLTETQYVHTCTPDIIDPGEHSCPELKLKTRGGDGVKTATHFTRTDFVDDEYPKSKESMTMVGTST